VTIVQPMNEDESLALLRVKMRKQCIDGRKGTILVIIILKIDNFRAALYTLIVDMVQNFST
jgi:hypothetical protein